MSAWIQDLVFPASGSLPVSMLSEGSVRGALGWRWGCGGMQLLDPEPLGNWQRCSCLRRAPCLGEVCVSTCCATAQDVLARACLWSERAGWVPRPPPHTYSPDFSLGHRHGLRLPLCPSARLCVCRGRGRAAPHRLDSIRAAPSSRPACPPGRTPTTAEPMVSSDADPP